MIELGIKSEYAVYVPILRPYCDSVNATLLFQRLEYHFSLFPEGFGQFTSPVHGNSMYRIGESWTEELNFSQEEFRNAFSKIGMNYRSKTKLEDVIKSGKDPFAGKYYLCYTDQQKHITFYLRNNDRVNALLKELNI